MNYKEKYLKYKLKYLQLKGGGEKRKRGLDPIEPNSPPSGMNTKHLKLGDLNSPLSSPYSNADGRSTIEIKIKDKDGTQEFEVDPNDVLIDLIHKNYGDHYIPQLGGIDIYDETATFSDLGIEDNATLDLIVSYKVFSSKEELQEAVNKYLVNPEDTELERYGAFPEWDTSAVTDMSYLFANKKDFNENISGWNIGKVKNMEGMFSGATNFNNGEKPLKWDTSGVENMKAMFMNAETFSQHLNEWNMDKVTFDKVMNMFTGAHNFSVLYLPEKINGQNINRQILQNMSFQNDDWIDWNEMRVD